MKAATLRAPATLADPPEFSDLAALRRAIAAIHVRLEALEQRNQADKPSSERDAALLSAIASQFGSAIFSVQDLQMCSNAEIRTAIAGLRPRQLGQWLRRLSRAAPSPYRINRVGRDARGCVWCVDVDRLHSRP